MASEVGYHVLKTAHNGSPNLRESVNCIANIESDNSREITIIEGENLLSWKRKAVMEGFVVIPSAQGSSKRFKSTSGFNIDKSTAAGGPFLSENEVICTNSLGDVTSNGPCSARPREHNSQKVSPSLIKPTLGKFVETSEERELHGSCQMSCTRPMSKASIAPSEGCVPEIRQAQQSGSGHNPIIFKNYSPDLSTPYKVMFVGEYASSTSVSKHGRMTQTELHEHSSPRSWSQECFGIPKRSSDLPSVISESGPSCIRSCIHETAKCINLGNMCANQAVHKADLHTVDHSDAVAKIKTEVEITNHLDLSSRRVETTGITRCKIPCVARLFDCLDPSQGDTGKLATTAPNIRSFSFQRLISGDITGLEHEFQDNSDEDCDSEQLDHDDSDMYSAVCTPSTQTFSPSLELGVETPQWESLLSDDLYSYHKHCSSDSPLGRAKSVELDSEISGVPLCVDESAASSMEHETHGSPCLQPKLDVGCEPTCSDASTDLYTEMSACQSTQQLQHETPFLDSSIDVYRPILPDALSSEDYSYSYSQHQFHGSPCMHPASKVDQQVSSDVSEDLSLCPRPHDTPGMNRWKDETATSSFRFNETPKGWPVCTEGKLMEVPGTAKAILSSGLLDGYPVSYHAKGGGVLLTGIVKNGGILCNCRFCKGRSVVNISCFEKHAGSTARHPSENIFFENGQSLHDIIRAGWHLSNEKLANIAQGAAKDNTSAVIVNKGLKACNSGSNSSIFIFPSLVRDLNKLLFLPGGLPDGTEVAYYIKGQRILTGTKMGHGIQCSCCNEVISCSLFEAHAGWGSRRNPYHCIFLSDGQSLHKYAQSLAYKLQHNSGADICRENDNLCGECGDGGDLVLCDACPGSFHTGKNLV
ncbi:hypothetical protein L7F22_021226 [Adiantum nelumboides]|nr:hypothetical protein [Adiantum nelumboides]